MPFFGPFVGSTFRIMWCSTMTFQRNAMIQKSCSWRTWRNANWWFEQQPKKKRENKQTIGWCVEKTQKSLGFNLFLCVRKVDYITTSFKNQHGTSHCDLIWIVSLFFESSRKSLVGSHQLDINPFWPRKKILGHASERSRNPLWVAIQIHTFQMPISHSCLGWKNNCSLQFFFVWDVSCRFRFLFFWANGQQENSPEKQQKRFLVSWSFVFWAGFLLIIWGPTRSWRPTSPRTCVWTAVDSTPEEKRMGS